MQTLGMSPCNPVEVRPLVQILSAIEEQQGNDFVLREGVTEPRIRFCTYREHAIILGCSQRALLEAGPNNEKREILVRAAGGGAVLSGPAMLSVSISLPTAHPMVTPGTIESYRWLGQCFADVLQDYGIDARAITPDEARQIQTDPVRALLGWACYGGLSPWEVVVDGRKIVGLAQVRRRTGVLLVAGLLLSRPDWAVLCRALGRPSDEGRLLADRNTSIEETLSKKVQPTDVAERLKVAMENKLNGGHVVSR